MDKLTVGLILAAICGGFVAGFWALAWLLEAAIRTAYHLRRNR
jgi:hypothetical protein